MRLVTKIVAITVGWFLLCCPCTAETIWIEAEHLHGVRGNCWPGGPNPKTDGHWAISGPGWSAEWTQGGESNFMSIACGPDDDRAKATMDVEIPEAGNYRVWVRYRDNRGSTSRFQVRLMSASGSPTLLTYGEHPVVEEDNEMKLYWNWAFGWEGHDAKLDKGKIRLELLSAFKEKECRQIDCIVLTNDQSYRPLIKERPRHPTTELLNTFGKGKDSTLEPLARRPMALEVTDRWKPRTFGDKGFLYLWNMDGEGPWTKGDPKAVLFPYHLRDKDVQEAFEKKYAGSKDVPIFSDPRIVPTLHGAGPMILATDAADPKAKQAAIDFVHWLDAHPGRPWAMMMNYAPDNPVTAGARANFLKYRDRYVGSIAGESLGYFNVDAGTMQAAVAKARNRRELVAAFSPLSQAANTAKYQKVFGQEWPDAYREVIPCPSIGMTAYAPLCYSWGARTVGYESSAITSGLLSLRMAFLRGAARQNGGLTATYRSCILASGRLLTIDKLTPQVYEIFEITRLDQFLHLRPEESRKQLSPPDRDEYLPIGVLVVDDDPAIRSVLKSWLGRIGFDVRIAAHGQEALELYHRHGRSIAVVLLDVMMPGMDGPHTLRALQRVNPAVQCCFMTGNPLPHTERELLSLGAVRVFRKPFAFSEVVTTLRQLANRSAQSRQDRWIEIPLERRATDVGTESQAG